MDNNISIEELTKIFDMQIEIFGLSNYYILKDKYETIIRLYKNSTTYKDKKQYLDTQKKYNDNIKKILQDRKILNDYLKNKKNKIEHKLYVFKTIPYEELNIIMAEFIKLLIEWNKRKIKITIEDTKKSQNNIYKKISKEITIIQKYQKLIEEYTEIGNPIWLKNDFPEFYKLNKELNNTYNINKKLLNELKTKNFVILDENNYRGKKVISKKPIKKFFENLKNKYKLKTMDIKQMIDVL